MSPSWTPATTSGAPETSTKPRAYSVPRTPTTAKGVHPVGTGRRSSNCTGRGAKAALEELRLKLLTPRDFAVGLQVQRRTLRKGKEGPVIKAKPKLASRKGP